MINFDELKNRLSAIEEANMSLAKLNKVAIQSFLERLNNVEEHIEMIMDSLNLRVVETPAKKEMVFVWEECDCEWDDCDCEKE